MTDKKIIFIDATYKYPIFNDLNYDDRVTVLHGTGKEIKSKVLLFIRKVHLSEKVNSFINLPFKKIWKNSLQTVRWKKDVLYYVIFSGATYTPITTEYLVKLKKAYNIKYIMYLTDSLESKYWSSVQREFIEKVEFDYIFSFDKKDSEKYGFYYLNAHYSILPIKSQKNEEYDLYFAGYDKGRLTTIMDTYNIAKWNNVTVKYRVNGVKKEKVLQHCDDIVWNQRLNYVDLLNETVSGNCILDLLVEGQSGLSARYYEAICYNKKLLTNNKNVVNMPFYNTKYIQVFEKPEDIDWLWVKERIPVNYHYDGRYSPTHIIDKLLELEAERGMQQFGKEQTD